MSVRGVGAGAILGLMAFNLTTLPLAQARNPRSAPEIPAIDLPLPPPRPEIGPAAIKPKVEVTPAPTPAPQPPPPPQIVLSAHAQQPAPNPAPATETSCIDRLREHGVAVETAAPSQPPDPRCTVADPVRMTGVSTAKGQIQLPDRPVVACVTAETFAGFVGDFVAPLAVGTFGDSPASISTGPGFECRPRNNVAGAKLSAHGQGLALDIAQIKLTTGRVYNVGSPTDDRDRQFDRAMRAGACGYFHTALGPGADAEHAHHWHMDLEPRGSKGDSKFCQ